MRATPFVIVLMSGLVPGFLLGALPAGAEEPYAVGDRITPLELEDQHGEVRSLDESVKLVLFSRDMNGGDLLRDAVADLGGEGLAGLGAVYIADIHRMPGLIARMFAIPSMRKRSYPMLLDRDGRATSRLPDLEDHATILELDRLTLRAIHHLASVEALQAQLGVTSEGDEAPGE